jgi:hypothetical protein
MPVYPVRFGPLHLVAVVGDTPEAMGDKLDAIGTTVIAGERAPRAAQITLAVRGAEDEANQRAAGFALRRQIRALVNNRAWRAHGLYWSDGRDVDGPAWIAVGTADLTEQGRGATFGDWRLQITDATVIGRPATHRRGRRVTVTDRAAGIVGIDTRGLLRSTDLAVEPADLPPAAIPGDVIAVTGYHDARAGRRRPSDLAHAGRRRQRDHLLAT